MELNTYQTYWDALQSAIREKMGALHARLVDELPEGIAVTDVAVDTDTDEFCIRMDVVHAASNITVMGLDFKLLDADEHGGDEGVGVALAVVGYAGLAMGGYYPANYTPEAFTTDLDNLKYRVASTPVEYLAGYVVGSLANPILLNVLEEEAGLNLRVAS